MEKGLILQGICKLLSATGEHVVFRRFISLAMVAVILSSQICDTVSAAKTNYDEYFYAGNDIVFYDPRCATETAKGYLTPAGKDNLEKSLNFLMRQGLTLAQASGVIGNLLSESKLNPRIIQGGTEADDTYIPENGKGFGIAQWTFTARQQPLVNYALSVGTPVTDLGVQLNFLWQELSGVYSSSALAPLKATDDPVKAAVIFHDKFEGSADSGSAVIANRGSNAARVYQTYSDAPALAGSSADQQLNRPGGDTNTTSAAANTAPSQTCISNGSGTGNLQQTVVAFAWPEYSKRIDQMPAYTDAVIRAKSEGRYIGGYNGNDCGAFVTLLVRNSGFDSRYNRDGFGGNTLMQEMWLSQNWDLISSTDGGDRQPGDVAINSGHTYIYVGEVGGFGSKIASASLGDRAPMAGSESPTDPSFRWYRKRAGGNTNDLQDKATGGGGGSW